MKLYGIVQKSLVASISALFLICTSMGGNWKFSFSTSHCSKVGFLSVRSDKIMNLEWDMIFLMKNFLSIPSAGPQKLIQCPFWRFIIYIGVNGFAFVISSPKNNHNYYIIWRQFYRCQWFLFHWLLLSLNCFQS